MSQTSCLQVASKDFCCCIACCCHGFREKLTILLFREFGIFVGEHFRNHIQSKFATVCQSNGKMVPEPVKWAEGSRKASCTANGIDRTTIFSLFTALARKHIIAVGKTLGFPFQLCVCFFLLRGRRRGNSVGLKLPRCKGVMPCPLSMTRWQCMISSVRLACGNPCSERDCAVQALVRHTVAPEGG